MIHVDDDRVLSVIDTADPAHARMVVETLDGAFRAMADGRVIVPAPTSIAAPDVQARRDPHHGRDGDADEALVPGTTVVTMSAMDVDSGLHAVKSLNDAQWRRPSQRSAILITDARTGLPVASFDGRAITRIRTAASTVAAMKRLYDVNVVGGPTAPSKDRPLDVGFIGAGALAVEHVRLLAPVLPIGTIRVWSRTPRTIDSFRASVSDFFARAVGSAVSAERAPRIIVCATPADVFEAEAVISLTPSQSPLIDAGMLRPGQLLNAVGAPPRADHREVSGATMASARIISDHADTVLAKSGDALLAIGEGHIRPDDVLTDLRDVFHGDFTGTPGQPGSGATADPDRPVIFNSVGMASEDLALCTLVLRRLGMR